MNRIQVWGSITLCGLLLAGMGCSSSGPEIKGTVTLDGKALAKARVNFEPVANQQGAYPATAFCDDNGNFTVIPQAEGRTLAPGTYGVTVSRKTDAQGNVPKEEDYGMMEAAGTLIESVPAKYTMAPTNGNYPLKVEIKEGKVDPIELKLTSQ